MGCDVGSGMVHWIPQEENNLSESKISTNIKTDTNITNNTANTTSTFLSPVSPVFLHSHNLYFRHSIIILNLQAQGTPNLDSPSKAPPVVSVNVPSSRPVIDNLSGTSNTSVNIDPSVITTAPPPPMANSIIIHMALNPI